MVVFDSVIPTLLLNEHADAPNDPATGMSVSIAREQVEFLVDRLTESHEKVIIPTPVLGEVFVVAGDAGLHYVKELQAASVFKIEPLDTIAAIELASMTKKHLRQATRKAASMLPGN